MLFQRCFLGLTLILVMAPRPALADPWQAGAIVPENGRENILALDPETWKTAQKLGAQHTLAYPVRTSRVLIPLELLEKALINPFENPILRPLQKVFKEISGIRGFADIERMAGLVPIAKGQANLYGLPKPDTRGLAQSYGTSFIDTANGTGVSFSCAACHVSELFGVPVFGLQNRFPKGNEFFIFGKKAIKIIEPHLAGWALGMDGQAIAMLAKTKESLARVDARTPLADGLDTSLAHVALSLSRRQKDANASFSAFRELFPHRERLRDVPADSKPGTWWNLKYKNKWLLDGSVVSGNPIFTNILWNEIGRGADLEELDVWLASNQKAVDDLTAAVFASKAPLYTDFFRADAIDLSKAKRGQELFNGNCIRCHGSYEKAWDAPDAAQRPPSDQLATTQVLYFQDTPVVDVGTDARRREGMSSLEQLNELAISQNHGIRVKVQPGYVPPPLVGIWARWPYFHNNSVPSLCAVLTRAEQRPKFYYAGEAVDPDRDFDRACNGYPKAEKAPVAWKTNPRRRYDTARDGMSNRGHDEGIFIMGGAEIYSWEDKMAIIEFLKTL